MRIPSGVVDQVLYFVAVDITDLKTRKTGLTTFTVYRARDGAAAAVFTTPTVTEVSSANMPGVYTLLLDEDMTIASGNQSEEVCLHITQASMAPVTRVYELYRSTVTPGETLTVSSGLVSSSTTITSVSGAVGSVTGAVGSVTGAVGSVTGAVGSVTGAVGSVTGAVGSVAGAVGSVTGLTVSDVNAIKLQTDKFVFTVANQVNANIKSVANTTVNGVGTTLNPWGP